MKYRYLYGPVPSRRLGFSLGVDLLPFKTCSFNCLYCQLGKTIIHTARRFSSVDLRRLILELKDFLKKNPRVDCITFSGSGEPTLHVGIGKIIRAVRSVCGKRYRIAVITNSSLLWKKEVRQGLLDADIVVASLDSVDEKLFQRIDHPVSQITLPKIISGLTRFRRVYKGNLWIEVMLLGDLNDTVTHARKLKNVLRKICPDRVHLTVPIRPAKSLIRLPSVRAITQIQKILMPAEIIRFPRHTRKLRRKFSMAGLQAFLQRRPATFSDLQTIFSVSSAYLQQKLEDLCRKGIFLRRGEYFIAVSTDTPQR